MQSQFAQQLNYFILPSSKPNAPCQLPDLNDYLLANGLGVATV